MNFFRAYEPTLLRNKNRNQKYQKSSRSKSHLVTISQRIISNGRAGRHRQGRATQSRQKGIFESEFEVKDPKLQMSRREMKDDRLDFEAAKTQPRIHVFAVTLVDATPQPDHHSDAMAHRSGRKIASQGNLQGKPQDTGRHPKVIFCLMCMLLQKTIHQQGQRSKCLRVRRELIVKSVLCFVS